MPRMLSLIAAFIVATFFLTRAHADDAPKAALGSPAPAFSLADQNGRAVNLSDFKGKIVVLEWTNPNCPFVQRHYKAKTMTTLAGKYADHGVVWLAINSTHDADNQANKQWADNEGLKYPVLNDSNGDVGHAYGAKTTPHMFIVDGDGVLRYEGGIDNDNRGNAADVVNYVDKALDDLLAGRPVGTPQTKSYGCSVKYR